MGSWQLITSDCLHDQLQGSSRHAQHGKDETEMVGVQAGHETAHIFERIANCEGVDERCDRLLLKQAPGWFLPWGHPSRFSNRTPFE
jgi:hypothetical protein